jgi:hypothetical protein
MGATMEQNWVDSYARAWLRWGGVGALLALLALPACGDDDAETPPASGCVTGQAVQCSCDNGTIGVQLCGRDGVFGGCFCTGPLGSGGTSSGSTGDPGSTPDAGASGSGAAGEAGGSGKAGGAGASGSGTAGAAGSAGSAGKGGSGNAGSSGSGNAGSSGSGNAGSGGSGNAGSGGSGGFGGSGSTVGTAYARCNTSGLCRDGLLCVDTMQGGGNSIGYCAPECTTRDDGTTTECPQPATGDVEAFCVPVANLCVLGPCGGEVNCPRGMMCSGNGPGSGNTSSCHYTTR